MIRATLLLLFLFAVCLQAQPIESALRSIQSNRHQVCTDAGANDSYTCTLSPAPTAYDAGSGCAVGEICAGTTIIFQPNTNNTGAATLTVGALASKNIKTVDGTTDPSNDALIADRFYLLTYDGTSWQITGGGTSSAADLSNISSAVNVVSGGTVNLTAANSTRPFRTTTVAGLPTACVATEMLYVTDARADRRVYHCATAGATPVAMGYDDNGSGCLDFATTPGTVSFDPECLFTATTSQVLDANSDAILANAFVVTVDPDANRTLTSTPTIADGSYDGQWLLIRNIDASFTTTLQIESGLTGSNIICAANPTIGARGSLLLSWSSAASAWLCEGSAGGGSGAPTDATYITQTANGTLSNEQALSPLATGPLKVANGTGVLSSGPVNLATEVTGTLPIANGGTGGASNYAAIVSLLNPRELTVINDNFSGGNTSSGTAGELGWGTSGTLSKAASQAGRYGVFTMTSTSTSFTRIFLAGTSTTQTPLIAMNDKTWTAHFAFKLDQTTTTSAAVGFTDNANSITADGYYFRYSSATDGNWHLITRAGGVETNTATFAASTGWLDLTIASDGAGNIAFYSGGTLLSTHTTNLDTGEILPYFIINNPTDATSVTAQVDYFQAIIDK